MARRSLRPSLNQIRAWVRQGRTDAWIAHQLEVTVQQVQEFRRENDLLGEGENAAVDFDDEIDLRAEDDALIAAELEEAAAQRAAARDSEEEEEEEEEEGEEEEGDGGPGGEEESQSRARRRGRRGGRGRRGRSSDPLEGTFDHGEEGYGLWLDPAVQDNPVYAEHWAGHRAVQVTVEEEQIVIRRSGGDD